MSEQCTGPEEQTTRKQQKFVEHSVFHGFLKLNYFGLLYAARIRWELPGSYQFAAPQGSKLFTAPTNSRAVRQ